MSTEENVALPFSFFSEILPEIDTIGELKVTLFAFLLLAQKGGADSSFQLAELQGDSTIVAALASAEKDGRIAVAEGLQQAVLRGTFLKAKVQPPGEAAGIWYWLHTPENQALLRQVENGHWPETLSYNWQGVRLRWQRPNIFTLYEQNIGSLTPLLADALQDAERSYPATWIEEAFRIAVQRNVRNWKYIRAILERWREEGKDGRTEEPQSYSERLKKYVGQYGDIIEH